MPGGRVSSNRMILSPVSRPKSFKSKKRPGVGEAWCLPPPAGTTKPLAAVMSVSFAVGCAHGSRLLQREAEGNRPGPLGVFGEPAFGGRPRLPQRAKR